MNNDKCSTLVDLAERYYAKDDFTQKGPTYLKSYTKLLENRRREELRVLELGVSSGASLLIWRDYLPRATIIGIDISEPPERILGQDRIHFIQGSQDDPAIIDHAAMLAGGSFDLIIDDASHIGYLTKRSLHYLFRRWLAPGGCYVIEDIGTGFLAQYPDGQEFAAPDWSDAVPGTVEFASSQHGMVGVVKQLIEYVMQELMSQSRAYIAIERLTIESNIVFIEKSMLPSGPLPGAIPVGPPSRPTVDRMVADLHSLTQTIHDQNDILVRQEHRLMQLEQVLARTRRALAPFLWLRRSIRSWRH